MSSVICDAYSHVHNSLVCCEESTTGSSSVGESVQAESPVVECARISVGILGVLLYLLTATLG